MYPQMYQSSWKTWTIAAIFTPISFLIGYTISLCMRMPADIRRTIGITTSVKSIAFCLTIIVISFPSGVYYKYIVIPELHSIIMMVELGLYCICFRIFRWCNGKYFMEQDIENDVNHTQTTTSLSDIDTISNGVVSFDVVPIETKNRNVNRRMSDTHAHMSQIALSHFKTNGSVPE